MKTIKIKDYYGIYQEIPVSDELYEEWRALLDGRQLRNRRIELYDLLVPDQSVLKLVKRKVLRHFLQIVHRGPVAVISRLRPPTRCSLPA